MEKCAINLAWGGLSGPDKLQPGRNNGRLVGIIGCICLMGERAYAILRHTTPCYATLRHAMPRHAANNESDATFRKQ